MFPWVALDREYAKMSGGSSATGSTNLLREIYGLKPPPCSSCLLSLFDAGRTSSIPPHPPFYLSLIALHRQNLWCIHRSPPAIHQLTFAGWAKLYLTIKTFGGAMMLQLQLTT
jgi:hypothetical protein